MRILASLLLLTLIAVPTWAADPPATWPQWRGPQRDGTVGGAAWPDSLQGEHLTQLWRVELSEGYPGPIVTEDRVFVVETKDRKTEIVRALDRKTGKQLWEASWPGSLSVPFFAKRNGDWVRATPAYDGERLYVAGMCDVLVCLDAGTGKELWRVDFTKRYNSPLPSFGFVSSPLVDGEYVYVQAGGSFVKLDRKTGSEVWRTLKDGGGMYGSAFASPTFATLGGARRLLVQMRKELACVDEKTGDVLWKQEVPAQQAMNIYTPTVYQDAVYCSTYGGGSFLYRVRESEGKFTVGEQWKTKTQGYMSTPIVIDGHAYVHLRNQKFACVDLATGEEKWLTDSRFGQYWSLVAQKDRLLALDQKGELLLIRANPEKFELLDRRKIADQETWGHLAVCGDELFIRELKAVAAYRWSK